jgi:hypothetical protein
VLVFFGIVVHTSCNEFVFHAVPVIAIGYVATIRGMSLDHLLVMNTKVHRPTCLQWCLGAIIASCKYNCHKTIFCNMHITKRL